MIEAIEGILAGSNKKDSILVNVNGLYFGVRCTKNLIGSLPPIGEVVRLETHLYIKEDHIELIAFKSELEKEFFRILISIQGIGPRNALSILGVTDINNFKNAILSENDKYLSKIPGIGPKTAKRLIVELKDKIKDLGPEMEGMSFSKDEYNMAFSGLINLGCSPVEATELLNFVMKQNPDKKFTAEELIINALKIRGSK